MAAYGSATINSVDAQRWAFPVQEPIGATNTPTPILIANGTPGGGLANADDHALFELGTPGRTTNGKAAIYVEYDVPVTAGAAAVTVAANHVTAATGGTYTSQAAAAAGQFGWVYVTT
jgi:hypothetical protein